MKWLIIIFLSLLMISLVSSAPLDTTAGKKYTPNTDTVVSADNKTTTVTVYSGIRNYNDKGTWKRIEDVASLSSGYTFKVIEDRNYPLTITDFNLTTVKVCVSSLTRETIIPLEVYHNEQTNIGEYIKTHEQEVTDCLNAQDTEDITRCVPANIKVIDKEYLVSMLLPTMCFDVEVGNIFINSIKWGSTSTVLKINNDAGNGDGGLYTLDSTWSATHDNSTADSVTNTATNIFARTSRGSFGLVTWYEISRGFIPFNTSSVPDNVLITNVTLSINVYNEIGTQDGDWAIVTTTQNSSNNLLLIDYDNVTTTMAGNPLDIYSAGLKTFVFNDTGLSMINKTGYTMLAIRNYFRDIRNSQPPISCGLDICHGIYFNSSESALPPYINITYQNEPLVLLNIPTNNNYSVNFTNAIFNFTVKMGVNDLVNATLYSDYNKTWKAIENKTLNWKAVTENQSSFTRNIFSDYNGYLDGGFLWNVLVYTNDSVGYWASSNNSFGNWNVNSTFDDIVITTITTGSLALPTNELSSNWFNMSKILALYHLDNDSSYGESATLVYDFSGNGYNLNPINATWTGSGKILGGAYTFNGINQSIYRTGCSSFDIKENKTISAWVKFNSLTGNQPVLVQSAFFFAYWSQWYLGVENNRVQFRIINASEVYINTSVSTSYLDTTNWHLLTARYDYEAKNMSLWIDGVNVNSTISTSIPDTGFCNRFNLGNSRETSSFFFNGTIDEVSVFNRSLSASEILEINNTQGTGIYDNYGEYYSKIFTNGTEVNFTAMSYNVSLNQGNVNVSYRMASDSSCSVWSSWSSAIAINQGIGTNGYCLQYKANLTASSNRLLSPRFNWVNVSYIGFAGGCVCAGLNNNWIITTNCVLSTNCELGKGNLSIKGGNFTINNGANLSVSKISKTIGSIIDLVKGSRIVIHTK